MKKVVLLFLLLSIPVSAAYIHRDLVDGKLSSSQLSLVTCEREKRQTVVKGLADKRCCINENKNLYCENDEPKLGSCEKYTCAWPTTSYQPAFSWKFTEPSCNGWAIYTGDEYAALLRSQQCDKKDKFWCCPWASFPPFEGAVQKPSTARPGPNPNGALMILPPEKWNKMKAGTLRFQKPEMRVLEFEQSRCKSGGGPVRVIDKQYGSWFADVTNIKPGWRAFFIKPDSVVPLITWCDGSPKKIVIK